ncbi:hypothetical protein HMI56_000617 [Coelomomyces lativittatus]|nr:hypothetical protein HMI56_000617 [Coelomomyces lativittatus]
MSFSEILEIQQAILNKSNWHIKIKDPLILKKYENELKSNLKDVSNFQKAIVGLNQLLIDEVHLKQKYENPIKHNQEKLPNTFFEDIRLSIKKNSVVISDALIPPAPILLNRHKNKDVEWLCEQTKEKIMLMCF